MQYPQYQPYQSTWNNPYLQLTQQTMPPAQQQATGLVRVTGIDGARAYQMPPNSTAALFDGNEPLFYVKSTDGGGFPTIKTFRFEEVTDAKPAQVEYATIDDITKLHHEIESMKEVVYAKSAVPEPESK
jgi:hypothetical protein